MLRERKQSVNAWRVAQIKAERGAGEDSGESWADERARQKE